MSKARIAVFEGYGAPLFSNPRLRGYGRRYGSQNLEMPSSMDRYGGPLFKNPRLKGYGRKGYRVDPYYEPNPYGPITQDGRRARVLKRKGYKVKKGRNSKAQVKFKKAAKKCARVARGRNARKGSFQACMRKSLKKKARRSKR